MFFKTLKFNEINSTNSFLLEKNNYQNLTFVFANHQTFGKGRENKKWNDEEGKDLLFSFLVRNKNLIKQNQKLSIFIPYLIIKFLEEKMKIKNVSIKWPNDIFINDKKVAGILLEANTNGEKNNFIVVGVGLNVNSDFKNFSNYKYVPTSLKLETKKFFDLNKLSKKISFWIRKNFILKKYSSDEILGFTNEHNYLKNKEVFFNENQVGIAKKINEDFSLQIEEKNTKKIFNIISSEVNIC